MDPKTATIIAGLIAFFGALLGSIVGGRIGARATLKAVQESHNQTLALEQQKQNAMISSVLLGIRAEIKAVWKRYEEEFGPLIEQVREGKALSVNYPVYQNYFTVYESNCSLIGQISDQELVEAIVTTYITAKSIMDTHILNNQLIKELKDLKRRPFDPQTQPSNLPQIIQAERDLKQCAHYFETYYEDMKTRVPQLEDKINRSEYLRGRHLTHSPNSSQSLQ